MKSNLLGAGWFECLGPFGGIVERRMELRGKVGVREMRSVGCVHEVDEILPLLSLPIPPEPAKKNMTIIFMRFPSYSTEFTKELAHTYHSLPYDGTLKTPQWTKIPNLASSYQADGKKEKQSGTEWG